MFSSKGWKGITGGIGLMVAAILLAVVKMVAPDASYGIGIPEAIGMFFAGLGVLGIRVAQTK
jgi:hypothetical protein